jgi:hypothetical protein
MIAALLTAVVSTTVLWASSGSAVAAPLTTAPGGRGFVHVVITDRKIAMDHGASAARGAFIAFLLRNNTGSTARFSLLGKVSSPVPPHGAAKLSIFLARRGAFVAKVKLASNRMLRETFVVY